MCSQTCRLLLCSRSSKWCLLQCSHLHGSFHCWWATMLQSHLFHLQVCWVQSLIPWPLTSFFGNKGIFSTPSLVHLSLVVQPFANGKDWYMKFRVAVCVCVHVHTCTLMFPLFTSSWCCPSENKTHPQENHSLAPYLKRKKAQVKIQKEIIQSNIQFWILRLQRPKINNSISNRLNRIFSQRPLLLGTERDNDRWPDGGRRMYGRESRPCPLAPLLGPRPKGIHMCPCMMCVCMVYVHVQVGVS